MQKAQKALATPVAALLFATQVLAPAAVQAQRNESTATPIKHVVVIFGENISFDHYFGTYPHALNRATSRALWLRLIRLPSMAIPMRCSSATRTC
jgi:phospholipase C